MKHFTHQAQFLHYDTITHCYKYSLFLPKLLIFSFILFLYPVDIAKQNALCNPWESNTEVTLCCQLDERKIFPPSLTDSRAWTRTEQKHWGYIGWTPCFIGKSSHCGCKSSLNHSLVQAWVFTPWPKVTCCNMASEDVFNTYFVLLCLPFLHKITAIPNAMHIFSPL